MSDQQQAASEQTNGGGELTPQARNEIAQYRMQHLDTALSGAPMAVRMYLDPILFDRVNRIAEMISASNSMPEHLRGDLGACMNVIDRAWNWGLSPWAVAQGQFTVRKGATPGYYGRLIIAAINNSGRIEGGLRFEHFADDNASWDNVLGKFEMRQSQKTDSNGEPIKYARATYKDEDERGLGVKVVGKLKGEDEPREMKVYLRQCQPRNSVIWATDPKTQIIYTAARRFGNAYCPDVLLGVRTEDDFGPEERGAMKDITPPAPPPVDLAAENIKGGGETNTTGRTAGNEPGTSGQPAPESGAGSKASPATNGAPSQPAGADQQQGGGDQPKPKEPADDKPAAQQASADTGEGDKPSWTVDGKEYVQPGRAVNAIKRLIGQCDNTGELDEFGDPDTAIGAVVSSLPEEYRHMVAAAVKAERDEFGKPGAGEDTSDSERADPPQGGDDDGDDDGGSPFPQAA